MRNGKWLALDNWSSVVPLAVINSHEEEEEMVLPVLQVEVI